MKKNLLLSVLLIRLACNAYGQTLSSDTRFSPQQLKADLAYLKQQIFDAHAYPYTELSQAQYEKVFDDIDSKLTDSATATAFYKLIKPTVAYLSDEHAQPWVDFIMRKSGRAEAYQQMIAYSRYGNAGYIDARSFDIKSDAQFDSVRNVVAGIFKQVKADGVKYLFIDISKNGGGNSEVGDLLINYFYNKPYRTYQCNWRRSDEYLAKIKSWGMKDDNYAAKTVGSLIHIDSETEVPENTGTARFGGKVYLVVGDGTFSSAMMFATVIKDNHIATIVGQAPQNGHPNHFGEMYDAKLPNTKIDVRFGVKEWIRPAGKTVANVLYPDIFVNLNKANTPKTVIEQIVR